jgi:TRAP-type uncharacterized transport system fused permease subunit
MIGDWTTIAAATATAAAGALLLAAGLHGYLIRSASLWERAFLVAAAFCLIKPGLLTDLAGATLTGAAVASQILRGRSVSPSPAALKREPGY